MLTRPRQYVSSRSATALPRLPLDAQIDVTYRCNNNCRHCWVNIAAAAPVKSDELVFDEITRIFEDARGMGCRKWHISGGEPMLRPDFPELFDYITSRSLAYSLNTNGTLITPRIAQLMKRRGEKMVALYGATPAVHDRVTRNRGSFEATMQGLARLKEAGAGFVVQLIPMRANYHQFKKMVRLAESLSPRWRIGAPWLYLRGDGNMRRNREILRQRLDPAVVVELDKPDVAWEEWEGKNLRRCVNATVREGLFASCIANRRDFHVDPYGRASFCDLIVDPALRFDLTQGSIEEFWRRFLPSLSASVPASPAFLEGCGTCALRTSCRRCPAHAYLEQRDYAAPVRYLCGVASETRKYKEAWGQNHRRYFQIADITVKVESDLPFRASTLHDKFRKFEVPEPGKDVISMRHHFALPDLSLLDLGREVYRKPPWAIYRGPRQSVYLSLPPEPANSTPCQVVVFNQGYSAIRIYHASPEIFEIGNLTSLCLLPTDQIFLAQVLSQRNGGYFHASGVILDGKGLLFVGSS